MKNWTNKFR